MIRSATVEDAAQIHALITEGIGGTSGADATWIIDRIHATTSVILVDVKDTTICGAIVSQIVEDEAEIHDVVVGVHDRRSGRGQNLVQHFEQRALALGAHRVFLEVRADNSAAIHLYTKLHYKQTAERPSYYADGQDALVMRKELSAAP